MIVMLVFVVVFVVSTSVTKSNFARQTRLCEKLECSIDRRLAHTRIFFFHQTVKVFIGKMRFRTKKDVEDEVSLGGAFETFSLNVVQEDFLFFRHWFEVCHVARV